MKRVTYIGRRAHRLIVDTHILVRDVETQVPDAIARRLAHRTDVLVEHDAPALADAPPEATPDMQGDE